MNNSVKIIGVNSIDEAHLRGVIKDMRALGPPTIRVIRHQGTIYAIEGTHRLEAAKRLGLHPTIVEIADDATDNSVVIHNVYDNRSPTVGQLRDTHIHTATHIRPTFEFYIPSG